MPLKVNWLRGRYFGLMLFYLGLCGLCQSLIIMPIGQYVMQIGSIYVLLLLPIGVSIAMTFSSQIIYEIHAKNQVRKLKKYKPKKNSSSTIQLPFNISLDKDVFRPIIIVILGFLIIFAFSYSIISSSIEAVNAFVIAENIGAIGVLIIATIMESQLNPSKRY